MVASGADSWSSASLRSDQLQWAKTMPTGLTTDFPDIGNTGDIEMIIKN